MIAIWFLFFPRIVDESTKKAAAVNQVEVEKVLKAAGEVGSYVDCVLTTHHHWYTIAST
jgi:hydroxyacylglutathione hydrolase